LQPGNLFFPALNGFLVVDVDATLTATITAFGRIRLNRFRGKF
jgi:hypothetical protein